MKVNWYGVGYLTLMFGLVASAFIIMGVCDAYNYSWCGI